MNNISNWIRRHQIAAFFLIAFAISWGLGFSWSAIIKHEQYLLLPLAFVTACGPGLAGIIVSAVSNTQPKKGPRKTFWIAFLAAWFISTLVCLANQKFYEQSTLSPAAVILFTISVVPVAFVIASAYSRNPAVRSYLSSLVRLRGVWGWSIAALFLIPALFLVSIPVSSFLSKQPIPTDQFPQLSLSLVGLVVVKFLYQFFFFNATGEETGWRGFALPRLQTRTSPLIAALVITLFWVPWHIFLWQAEGRPVLSLEFWIEMYIGHLLLSVMIVWICNRAKGSILVAGIAHAATNTVQAFTPSGSMLLVVLSVAALLMILVDKMWRKLPADFPALVRQPGLDKLEADITDETLEVSHV